MKRELGENPRLSRSCKSPLCEGNDATVRPTGRRLQRGVSQKTCRRLLFTMRFEDRRLLTLSMMRGVAISALLCFVVVFAAAQPKSGRKTAFDSIQHVGEVVITQNLTYREVIPSHTMKGKELERLNAHNIADALRYFAGLQLKDYGGVGGIKTVNIRSMGSNHVGIFYDGIQLGNAQNGQVDLGQFSMDNVDEITLYNGQKSAIFQPASEFGNAGSVYIKTRRPKFTEGRDWNLKVKTKYASSDHFRLSTLWEQRLSRMVSSSVNAEFISSSGKYDFRYRRLNQDGTVAYDTTATRHNGDVWAMRAEAKHSMLRRCNGWDYRQPCIYQITLVLADRRSQALGGLKLPLQAQDRPLSAQDRPSAPARRPTTSGGTCWQKTRSWTFSRSSSTTKRRLRTRNSSSLASTSSTS